MGWPMINNAIYLSFQITVTPLGALSRADIEYQAYFKDWLPGVAECFSSSTL